MLHSSQKVNCVETPSRLINVLLCMSHWSDGQEASSLMATAGLLHIDDLPTNTCIAITPRVARVV